MADTTKAGNTATQGDHDRVAMLSLHADGKPAQYNPETHRRPRVRARGDEAAVP
jgi:hypothetical protein